MPIHIVAPGDTLFSVAARFDVPHLLLAAWNGLRPPYRLAVGQSLGVFTPSRLYTVREGDTLFSISRNLRIPILTLLQRNPQLGGRAQLFPGQTLVLSFAEEGTRPAVLSGYAYPFADEGTLSQILPYASDLIPFTYGIGEDGLLVPPDDERLLRLARQYGARPVLHLSTLTERGSFSTERAAALLQNPSAWMPLADAIVRTMTEKGYEGLDVDFEFLGAENAAAYAEFAAMLRERVNALGYELTVALAPKTSDTQRGVLYEGHDYAALGAAADAVLLMTYEWGYTYGPPLAVAPLPSVRRVLDYAVTRIEPSKILLGFPNYGYDWALPYEAGTTRAQSISNVYAAELAAEVGAEIRYDESAQAPFFTYTAQGVTHEVWFEDARSCSAKFALVPEYGFRGVGYWNFMRPFPVSFLLLAERFALMKR
ncbi:MAG: LysM peptidoglycan-binding domain-containing protein [Oscillospiraceae bacterium]|nr:LysM peptidoglycan-binding domain-containing protein [Oscillospiraceae bacterium]